MMHPCADQLLDTVEVFVSKYTRQHVYISSCKCTCFMKACYITGKRGSFKHRAVMSLKEVIIQ